MKSRTKHLCIVGLGIKGCEQLTLEGVSRLKSVEKVFYLPIVAPETEAFLKNLGIPEIEDLLPLYLDGEMDLHNYEKIFSALLSGFQQFGSIGLLVPGHPRVGVTLVQWIEQRKEQHQIDLDILPGICSFSTMINDLERDPLEKGSVIVDANRLLLLDYRMEPSLDYYIYHVCSVGTSRVYLSDAAFENRLDLLQEHLLKFYNAGHLVKLVSSSSTNEKSFSLVEATIANLHDLLPFVHFGTTLFIPGAKPKTINRSYLELLKGAAQ